MLDMPLAGKILIQLDLSRKAMMNSILFHTLPFLYYVKQINIHFVETARTGCSDTFYFDMRRWDEILVDTVSPGRMWIPVTQPFLQLRISSP